MENKKIYLKDDVFLPILKDYGFKLVESDKKSFYKGNGLEIDADTKELKTANKTDLIAFLKMYNDNILIIK